MASSGSMMKYLFL
nr:TPA_asm: m22.5 uORF 1 [Murid betaherpesvirus 1]DBA07737.1 TPA_asm: m22.5 uORF 1 [Murid betaherpesvirus 1]